jgi:DNA modification methylase
MGKGLKKSKQQSGLFRSEATKMPDGYYSGDQPNPNLRAFVEAHLKEKPYDPETDDYDVPAFDKSIETTKATAIYNMHTYWSKKPHDAIRQYIKHYTEPGDLVLDQFCGSGGTALAAMMEGRKAIAIDRSPAATFITKNYCTPVDVEKLQEAFEELKGRVQAEMDWLYETRCSHCLGKATTYATVYSAVFQCTRCLSLVPLLHADARKTGFNKVTYLCPHCRARGVDEEISLRSERQDSVVLSITYRCEKAECRKQLDTREIPYPREDAKFPDLTHLSEVEKRPIKAQVPDVAMMHTSEGRWGLLQRPYHGQMRKVADFYSARNLRAMAILTGTIRDCFTGHIRDLLLFAVEAISMNMSKLQGYSTNPRFPNNMMKGTLYTPPIWREYNALDWLEGKIRNLVAGYRSIESEGIRTRDLMISTQSACDLAPIQTGSIDYVFTDPPYSYKIQFGELNFMWEAWLGMCSDWKEEEIIVNDVRLKDEEDWRDRMSLAMAECYRVLKPGRWVSLCYHDSAEGSWQSLQDMMAECGFLVDKGEGALYIDTDRKSWKQLVADKVTKRDLVINFRKPKPGEIAAELTITGDEDPTTFNDKVRAVICDYLTAHPGSSKDRIYDELVSRMVRKGQMEAHNFDELLSQVAEPVAEELKKNLFEAEDPNLFGTHRVSRWYLKETQMAVVDAAESAKEDSAAKQIGAFIANHLKKQPAAEGVHYSDLFEHYVYTVKDKPRRPLGEWLLDYFFKTEAGTYRLPHSEEESALKEEGRTKGTNRRVKRYVASLEQGVAIPESERPSDATLAEWIRHAKRTGLFEFGKLLYEKGGLSLEALPEAVMAGVEEDYQVCVRTLARDLANDKNKTRKSRKSRKEE